MKDLPHIIAAGGDLSIPLCCGFLNCSRSKLYADAKAGLIKITKRGRRSVITAADARARQERESER